MINRLLFFNLILLYIFVLPIDLIASSPEKKYLEAFQLSLEGKNHQAISIYLEVLKLMPKWAEAHHNLGILYYKIDMGVKALDHFRKAKYFYSVRNDPQSKTNLAIIQKNLDKGYKKLNINAQDFEAVQTLPKKKDWHQVASGFLIGPPGHVLTSWQAVKQANKVRVRFPDGKILKAVPISKFIVYNIALLKIIHFSDVPKTVLKFGDSSVYNVGEVIFLPKLISDYKTEVFPQKGAIREVNALEDNDKFFQIDIPLREKQNGTPLFNSQGYIIGMLFSKTFMENSYVQTKNLSNNSSFAIKSNYLQRILNNILNRTSSSVEKRTPIFIGNPTAFSYDSQMNLVTIETIP